VGLDVRRYQPASSFRARRARIMAAEAITLVLDVGANAGQYGDEVRAGGYRGRLVSFEPLPGAFAELARHAAEDPAWDVRRVALADRDGEAVLHVAGNGWSSSLLPMTARHVRSAPESAYVGAERVTCRPLDALASELVGEGDRVLLKLDVQGSELRVLAGAARTLPRVALLEVELSLAALYEGAPLLRDALAALDGLGYDLVGLEPGFSEPASGHLLQADGLFLRRRT
jgi:FkbM family methyltransferase